MDGFEKAGNGSVFGVIDWDTKNEENGRVFVLGYGQRYSIESYILDPLLIGALLLREKVDIAHRDRMGVTGNETHVDLRDFGNDRLQRIADVVTIHLGYDVAQDRLECEYVNGRRIQIPKALLTSKGHELETLIKANTRFCNGFIRRMPSKTQS